MSDFRIEYKGLILNNNTYPIMSIDGIGTPAKRTAETNLTGAHGGNIWEQKYAMRVIQIEGAVIADTASDYFANVKELLNAYGDIDDTASEMKITRWDGTIRTIMVKPYSAPITKEVPGEVTIMSNFRVVVKAENPFFRDESSTTYTTYLAESGGAPLSSPLPMTLGSLTNNTLTINNTGSVSGYASYRITGNVNTPYVLNATNGKWFKLNTTLGSGDYVDIYKTTEGLFVVKNGTTNYMQYFEGDFFEIETGNNLIKFNAAVYSSEAKLEATWYNLYLSVYE